jgi:hypothetical protein
MLANVAEAAREAITEIEAGKVPEWIEAPDALLGLDDTDAAVVAFRSQLVDDLTELADTCDEYGDRADGLEFPGMY